MNERQPMNYPSRVTLVEVGPRDGLQNEATPLHTNDKIAFINTLSQSHLQRIEVGSLVSPQWVPQMADSDRVFEGIEKFNGVSYSLLVPNQRGLDKAIALGVREIAVFASASETFSNKNINCSIQESLQRYEGVMRGAMDAGMRVRGYVSCVAGCPYEGDVAVSAVAEVTSALLDLGCYEVSLGDTIGMGTPNQIESILNTMLQRRLQLSALGIHCHDTYGMAIANILMALQCGVAVVDSAVAGLGGCPYAKGASGNVATEDVLYLLHGLGIETGVNLDKVIEAGQQICNVLGIKNRSNVANALLAKQGES